MILTDTRRDLYLPLAEFKDIPQTALERLARLGVTTLNELRDIWNYGNRILLVDYLNDSPVRWFKSISPPLLRSRGTGESAPIQPTDPLQPPPDQRLIRHPRGLALTMAQQTAKAAPPAKPPRTAAKTVNLAHRFPPVRNQGERGTCVAFASIALLEYHLYPQAQSVRQHAEQFVYWACKQIDGLPDTEGTYIESGRQVLNTRGACFAETWPYRMTRIEGNAAQHPPPQGAEQEALRFKLASSRVLDPWTISALCASLDEGKPVVLGVKTFPAWDFPSVGDSGEIPMPLPNEQPDGGHAVCVVGYELRDRIPGGGAFIFRNSWGREWGQRSGRFSPGYGTLFFDYVRLYGIDAFA